MTEEQFSEYRFRHSEIIVYHQKHPERNVECMLIGINFDNQMLNLSPLDTCIYEDESFWTPIEYCEKKRAKLKLIVCDPVTNVRKK